MGLNSRARTRSAHFHHYEFRRGRSATSIGEPVAGLVSFGIGFRHGGSSMRETVGGLVSFWRQFRETDLRGGSWPCAHRPHSYFIPRRRTFSTADFHHGESRHGGSSTSIGEPVAGPVSLGVSFGETDLRGGRRDQRSRRLMARSAWA